MGREGDVFVVDSGMPHAIWNDKYARDVEGRIETWEERATAVAEGNVSLQEKLLGNSYPTIQAEAFKKAMLSGVLPMSGRHLQHGDSHQHNKRGELFTNCSTACFSFMKFLLLMKGSGVGRLYDEDICLADWRKLPRVVLVLGEDHPDHSADDDYYLSAIPRDESRDNMFIVHRVADSAEGWAAAIALLEGLANYKNPNPDNIAIVYLDFSRVRCLGTPIMGQQGRPASGPKPLMRAISSALASIQDVEDRWEQALIVDHELSECVRVGGVRRSARIAVKSWWDKGIERFIDIKEHGGLWTANNSVGVNNDFWERLGCWDPVAQNVWNKICSANYTHNTGEPGVVNIDLLSWDDEGTECLDVSWYDQKLLGDMRILPGNLCYKYVNDTLECVRLHPTKVILNPCGEVPLAVFGGYCIIGEVCLANARTLEEVVSAIIECGKALVRINLLPFTYHKEVKRTNRIGVGITGIHEFAWLMFGLTWEDLCDKEKSSEFWSFMSLCRGALKDSLSTYCKELGLVFPATFTCIKPSGTISKVMDCTEGGHLPAYAYYMRWVQFRKEDPKVEEYQLRGYPVKDISHKYAGSVVVGFPTSTRCGRLMGDKVTLAGEATIQEQYRFVQNLEEFWLGPQGEGGQVSYTIKYDKKNVSFDDYVLQYTEGQSSVRACAIMPQVDLSAYAYQPEERITEDEYYRVMGDILHAESLGRNKLLEAYDKDALTCEGGACPIEADIR